MHENNNLWSTRAIVPLARVHVFTCVYLEPGTVENWYHASFDMGGQLGPSSFVRVDSLDLRVLSEWTTGTKQFNMGGQLVPSTILLINHLSWTGVDNVVHPDKTRWSQLSNHAKNGMVPVICGTRCATFVYFSII